MASVNGVMGWRNWFASLRLREAKYVEAFPPVWETWWPVEEEVKMFPTGRGTQHISLTRSFSDLYG